MPAATTALSQASQALVASLVPRHPFAHLPCLLEIRPGAGGSEAALFAGNLLRMYRAYCARRGLRATLLKYEETEAASSSSGGGGGDSGGGADAPLQEAVLEIDEPGAYAELRCEAGVHRVQRVPATETKGRTHTSAASVMVLPALSSGGDDNNHNSSGDGGGGAGGAGGAAASWNDPASDYYVDPKDVRTDAMRASGAGGQHVNKTESAIRLTHEPTGTVVSIQESRSQLKNREKAWRLLRARLAQARREARDAELLQLRRSVVGVARIGRGDKVRTYNWGQQRVTDHRSGVTVHNLDDVLHGGEALAKVMESVRAWLAERDLEALMAADDQAGSSSSIINGGRTGKK